MDTEPLKGVAFIKTMRVEHFEPVEVKDVTIDPKVAAKLREGYPPDPIVIKPPAKQ